MKRNTEAKIFSGLQAPRPPDGLKERVLSAARASVRDAPAALPLETRVWRSRKLRAAWAALVVLLLCANLYYTSRPRHTQLASAVTQDRKFITTQGGEALRDLRRGSADVTMIAALCEIDHYFCEPAQR